MHYKEGDLYRTEKVNVWDDVTGFGWGKFAKGGSSVVQTNAAKNILNDTSYTYNVNGLPYMAKDLDSIDIDFVPDARFDSEAIYRYQNWDIQMAYGRGIMNKSYYVPDDYKKHPFIGVGTIKAIRKDPDTDNKQIEDFAAWSEHLRSHATLNFGKPYPERERYKKTHDEDRDILWVRIESEPMLSAPDNPADATSTDPKNVPSNLNNKKGMTVLSSVRQIIITFTQSNTGSNDRPVVIFYDGPEIYKKLPNTHLRESKPVIINLQADTNAIFYLPNSPVIFLPNGHNFKGFIVAKSYVRLKTEEDFRNENADNYYDELEIVDYYDKVNIDANYKEILISNYDKFAVKGSKVFRRTEAVANPYYHTSPKLTGEPETINWTYTKIINPDNGIEMYVDDYGNVQYVEDADSKTPHNSGTYNTFGRTHFTTHNHKIPQTATYNLMVMAEN